MKRARHQVTSHHSLVICVGLLLLLTFSLTVRAQNDLCINANDPVTGPPQSIDGIVFAVDSANIGPDIGWTNATRYNLNAGGLSPQQTGLLQLIRTNTDVYLSLVLDSPTPPDPNETIVIALSTDGTDANDWRFHIKFFDTSLGADGANRSPLINYWRRSVAGGGNPGWNDDDATPSGPRPWMTNNIKFSLFNGRRTLEMKIPIEPVQANASGHDAIYFPTGTTTFKLYVNALSTNFLLGVAQSPWPSGVEMQGGDFLIEHNTPAKNLWGTASFDLRPQCTGVSIAESDIGVQSPPAPSVQSILRFKFGDPEVLPSDCSMEDNVTSVGPVNTFFATVRNNGSDAANVNVTFRTANWGIPPEDATKWLKLGCSPGPPACGDPANLPVGLTGTNPTSDLSVPASGNRTFTVDWALTRRQSCQQAKGGIFYGGMFHAGHQCMVVELSSGDASTRFVNTGIRRNMNFVTASKVVQEAEISAVGYGAPPAGRAKQKFIITVDKEVNDYELTGQTNQYCKTARKSRGDRTRAAVGRELLPPDQYRCFSSKNFPKGMTQAMTWIARGYRMTGDFLIINGTKYEIIHPVGGFGYIAGHNGDVAEWKQSFEGGGLQKVNDNFYTIEIPPEQVARVVTTIEAVEAASASGAGFFSVGLRGGAAIPQGAFNNIYDPGVAFTADLEYHATNIFSVSGQFGYRRFKSDLPPLVSNLNLFQFSGGPKVYLSSGSTRPFINGGIGAFKFDPGSTKFGAYVGGGLQFRVWPKVWLEGEYNFHSVFTSGQNFKFSTVQGGVRFRF